MADLVELASDTHILGHIICVSFSTDSLIQSHNDRFGFSDRQRWKILGAATQISWPLHLELEFVLEMPCSLCL